MNSRKLNRERVAAWQRAAGWRRWRLSDSDGLCSMHSNAMACILSSCPR